jgi:hypothetical protein
LPWLLGLGPGPWLAGRLKAGDAQIDVGEAGWAWEHPEAATIQQGDDERAEGGETQEQDCQLERCLHLDSDRLRARDADVRPLVGRVEVEGVRPDCEA